VHDPGEDASSTLPKRSERTLQKMKTERRPGRPVPSQDAATAIMDAAERRMRVGGFGGFSFRDVAADVGIKSSSVHYHFPTKEKLAAAVVRRYTEEVAEIIDRESTREPNPIRVWTRAFRSTLHSEERMCPCIVLGAEASDLPKAVTAEVKRFFEMCLEKLEAAGVPQQAANQLLATITGAMVVANSMRDLAAYDRATQELVRASDSLVTRTARRRSK
jgi:TetR/AcrR family transcriptional regulator, transcriptional repressor for nem operon